MKDLSIKHTLTEICQTGIDLAQCARIGLDKREKIALGIGNATLCLSNSFTVGSPLISTYYCAVAGSVVLGVYGTRQKQLWKSMVGGAIAGITATGFSILAAPILGGNPVGLTSSATRLAAGASGGALVAIAAAQATKSNLEIKCSSCLGMGMLGTLGGVLLGAGVSGGLLVESIDAIPLVMSAPICCVISIQHSGFCAIATDSKLYSMISFPNQHNRIDIFSELLNKKECLSGIHNPSTYNPSFSYQELLIQAIIRKVPAEWFELLSNKAQGNYNWDVVIVTLIKFAESNPEDQTLYSKYLQHLLVKKASNSINEALLELCNTKDRDLCELIREHKCYNQKDFSDALLAKKILSEIYRYIPQVSPRTPYEALLTLAITYKVPAEWFKMLLDQSLCNLTDDEFCKLPVFINEKISASNAKEKTLYSQYLRYLLFNSKIITTLSTKVFNELKAVSSVNPGVEEGVPQENSTESDEEHEVSAVLGELGEQNDEND